MLLALGCLALIAVLAWATLRRLERLQREAAAAGLTARAAERMSALKSELLASVSHEIRTPLNAILGMTDLLATSPLGAEQRDHLDTIRTSGDTLLSLLNDLLDFSKIEAGKLDLEQTEYDPRSCLEDVAELFGAAAARRGIELVLDLDPSFDRSLSGDPLRVRQVVSNLVSNAVKFTSAGEVVISAAVCHTDDGRRSATISVRDTGIGIAEARLAELFRPFAQADSSTARKYGGTGLGLSISRKLAELMGGSLSARSAPGVGSVFTLSLPAARVRDLDARAHLPRPLSGKHALVLAENGNVRRVLSLQLQGFGMHTSLAESPEQARRALGQDTPHVALLDLDVSAARLPDLVELERALGDARVQIVGLRGGPADSNLPGPEAVLAKPVRQRRLLEVLSRALGDVPIPLPAARRELSDGPHGPLLRVLVVDDNPVNRALFAAMLEKLGHEHTLAASGGEALGLLTNGAHDVVMMDVQMPEMNGLEAVARLRTLPIASQPWVLGVTAHAMRGDRERCLASGMNDYLAKPVRLRELAAALQRAGQAVQGGGALLPLRPLTEHSHVQPVPRARLDPELIGAIRDLGGGVFDRALAAFLSDAPVRLEQFTSALRRSDAVAAEAAVHTLKGASSMLGGSELAERCEELCRILRAGDVESARALAGPFGQALCELSAAFEDLLARPSAIDLPGAS